MTDLKKKDNYRFKKREARVFFLLENQFSVVATIYVENSKLLRCSDYLNNMKGTYIPCVDCVLTKPCGQVINYKTMFINKNKIISIVPEDDKC